MANSGPSVSSNPTLAPVYAVLDGSGAPTGGMVANGQLPSGALTPTQAAATQALVSGYGVFPASGVTLPAGLTVAQALPKFRQALARSRSGGSDVLHIVVGDSTTMGDGAGTGSNGFVGARNRSYAQCLAREIGGRRFPTGIDNFSGNQMLTGVTQAQYDPRLNIGAWVDDTGANQTVGGQPFKSSAGGSTLAFTPFGVFDSFDVYCIGYGGGGSFNINVDGGSTLATFTDSAPSITKLTASCVRGTHTINLVSVGATVVYALGVVCHDSKTPRINILQSGHSGLTIGTVVGNPAVWNWQNTIAAMVPDLTTLNFNINDMRFATSQATYVANLQIAITAAKASGDVVLAFSHYIDTAQCPQATQDIYKGYVQALAASNGLIFVDRSLPLAATYAAANAAGLMYDGLHPNAIGYGLQAAQEAAIYAALA